MRFVKWAFGGTSKKDTSGSGEAGSSKRGECQDDLGVATENATAPATGPREAKPTASFSHVNYKLIVVGDGNVGKSAWVRSVADSKYSFSPMDSGPTLGAEKSVVQVRDGVTFVISDCGGAFVGLKDGYYYGADCAIVMYDVANRQSFQHVWDWIDAVESACGPDIPILVVGNKTDIPNADVAAGEAALIGYPFCELSVAADAASDNLHYPLLHLARRLFAEHAK